MRKPERARFFDIRERERLGTLVVGTGGTRARAEPDQQAPITGRNAALGDNDCRRDRVTPAEGGPEESALVLVRRSLDATLMMRKAGVYCTSSNKLKSMKEQRGGERTGVTARWRRERVAADGRSTKRADNCGREVGHFARVVVVHDRASRCTLSDRRALLARESPLARPGARPPPRVVKVYVASSSPPPSPHPGTSERPPRAHQVARLGREDTEELEPCVVDAGLALQLADDVVRALGDVHVNLGNAVGV